MLHFPNPKDHHTSPEVEDLNYNPSSYFDTSMNDPWHKNNDSVSAISWLVTSTKSKKFVNLVANLQLPEGIVYCKYY